ncbi:MAG: 4Fe-4S dicluster domain-containing protein, partial [Streptosporangiaceae bacterium]
MACKEWNAVPEDGISLSGMSYDNTVGLGASTWRHVAFIEQPAGGSPTRGGTPPANPPSDGVRWLMSSDVCKHCTESACLDVCPTGALFRTEFGTVVVQDDVCNGCGYCVPACPFGVIARREEDGQAHKCTLCYDRLGAGLEPACAKACPTQSIQFGPLDELRERARLRVEDLHAAGQDQARLYLDDPADGIGGGGAISLSAAALVHDLGRPARFTSMLRVFKPSSPMSVGSWLLAGYGPVAGAAAVSEVTG